MSSDVPPDPLEVTPESANEPSVPSPLQRAHRSAPICATLVACAVAGLALLAYLSVNGFEPRLVTTAHYASVPLWLVVLWLSFEYARLGGQASRVWSGLGVAWVLGGAMTHWAAHAYLGELPAAQAMVATEALVQTGHSERFLRIYTAFVVTVETASGSLLWVGAMGHFRDVARALGRHRGPAPWSWLVCVLGLQRHEAGYRRARAWYAMPILAATFAGTQGGLDGFSGLHHLAVFDGFAIADLQQAAGLVLGVFVLAVAGALWLLAHRQREVAAGE